MKQIMEVFTPVTIVWRSDSGP